MEPLSSSHHIIEPKETTIDRVGELVRAEQERRPGRIVVGILYDVSPVGAGRESQAIMDALARNPRVVICDHHNGAAPIVEVPGREVTGAEVILRTMPRIVEAAGRAGKPLHIVGVTNSMNFDPDALVCRYLIDKWERLTALGRSEFEATTDLLVRTARFGDTTLFGGVEIATATFDTARPHERLAFALLHCINEEKTRLVVESKLETILARHNLLEIACRRVVARIGDEGVIEAVLSDDLLRMALIGAEVASLEMELGRRLGVPQEPDALKEYVRGELGDSCVEAGALERIIAEVAPKHGLRGAEVDRYRTEEMARIAFGALTRAQVREVFEGKREADLYGPPHPPAMNGLAMEHMFGRIVAAMDRMILTPETTRDGVDRFLKELAEVHALARRCTRGDELIAVTTVTERRLDYQPELPHQLQRFYTTDWLRNASAAMMEQWLHLMVTPHLLVLSARFARPGEEESRPIIDLSNPEFREAIHGMEREAAAIAGEAPVGFMFKGNLMLPGGRPHFSVEQLLEVVRRFESKLIRDPSSEVRPSEPVFARVRVDGGRDIAFDGAHYLDVARDG